MHLKFRLFLGMALSAGVAFSQQMAVSGPIEGYVFDAPTGSFRAVLGFPGSASLGPALLQGFSFGSIAPHKNYAIAFKGAGVEFIAGLGLSGSSAHAVPGSHEGPEGVAWSGDGSLAVLYSRTGKWIQYLAGFPGSGCRLCQPSVHESVDLSSIGGAVSAVAVDFSGTRVALGAVGGGVHLSTHRQAFVPVLQASDPIALAFSEDTGTLYALNGRTLQLEGLSLANHSLQSYSLAGLKDPFALKAALDASGRTVVYIASRKDRILRIYDPIGHQILNDLALDFAPAAIDDLGVSSFLLAPRKKDSDALWLLSSAPRRAIYFVPALRAEGSAK